MFCLKAEMGKCDKAVLIIQKCIAEINKDVAYAEFQAKLRGNEIVAHLHVMTDDLKGFADWLPEVGEAKQACLT